MKNEIKINPGNWGTIKLKKMKKLFILFFLFSSFNIFSQSLPNNDFENWEWDTFHLYQEPENWNTPNPYTILLGKTSVTESDEAFSGSHSAKLETLELLEGQIIVPGILTLADFSINILDSSYSMGGGYFLQENVYKLTGRYKYSGVDGDSASILMYNFKNTIETGFDTIGAGYTSLTDTDEWQPFTIMMQYLNNSVPDTFNMIISSSSLLSARAGSTLWIDSLSIFTNTGIVNLWNPKKPLKVYPNPALEVINFSSETMEDGSVLTIYDNFGRKITDKNFTGRKTQLEISDFPPGFYTYMLNSKNEIINSGTFIKN